MGNDKEKKKELKKGLFVKPIEKVRLNWSLEPGGINFVDEDSRKEFEEWCRPINVSMRAFDDVIGAICNLENSLKDLDFEYTSLADEIVNCKKRRRLFERSKNLVKMVGDFEEAKN